MCLVGIFASGAEGAGVRGVAGEIGSEGNIAESGEGISIVGRVAYVGLSWSGGRVAVGGASRVP